MKLNRFELAGILASFALVILAGTFALTHVAYADDVDPCSLPGMGMLGCDDNEGDMEVPVDPCEITPCDDDEPSLGEQITCEVYEELMAQGEPIPQGFDASGCDDGNGGGNGGGDDAACEDGTDNDNDGLVDSADPGCSGSDDDDETNSGGGGSGATPACKDGQDNDSDGKTDMDDPGCTDENDTDENDGSSGGGGGGSGGGGGGGGSVAGTASTTCDTYLTAFIKFGQKNDEEQVKRLQHVLKAYEGASVEENGIYDQETLSAVHAFQTKYWDTILAPWNIKQSTGFVYLTTRKKVNEIYCKNEVMFPLTEEENALIEATKKPVVTAAAAAAAKPAAKPAQKPAAKPETKTEKKDAEEKAEEGTTRSGWGAVGDFFRRLFNRGR
jgi:hypothetical protein